MKKLIQLIYVKLWATKSGYVQYGGYERRWIDIKK